MCATISVGTVKCPLAMTMVVPDCFCLPSYFWLYSRKPIPKTQTHRYSSHIPINASGRKKHRIPRRAGVYERMSMLSDM
jgi:hypothetical protein